MQSLKAPLYIFLTPLPIETVWSFVQSEKAFPPISSTLFGIFTVVILTHFENALLPIVFTELPIVRVDKLLQF